MLSEKQLVRLVDREQLRFENRALREVRKITRRFGGRIEKQFKRTGMIHLAAIEPQHLLQQELRQLLYVQHLQGVKRGRLIFKSHKGDLELARATAGTIRVLERQLNIRKTNKLQKQFSTEAFRVLNGITNKLEVKLKEAVNDAIARGLTVRNAAKRIRAVFEAEGLSILDAQIETIYRTQSQIAYNAGRFIADAESGKVWGYKYVTMRDDRVRPTHAYLDGMIMKATNPAWETLWPPNGWNCRCQVVPLFKPVPIRRRPRAEVDEGFDFNPGIVFSP